MSASVRSSQSLPWWKEPTKDHWYAYVAAWLGWALDAFDFTVFLVLIVPIAKQFDAPLALVAVVGTLTLWMRLLGAVAAGWMADRLGRKAPLMISILWYSICNFIAGFSPNLTKSRCSQRFPLRRCAYSENSDRSRQRGSGRMFPYGGGRTRPAGLRCER